MSGKKRDFPFSNDDVPHVLNSDFMSPKRACLSNKYNYSQNINEHCVENMICEQTVMDLNYNNNFENYAKNDKVKVLQDQDISDRCDNNKNTTSSVCLRCQAGEPGHIGHIGR